MKKFRELIRYLMREELQIQHRLINIFLIIGTAALFFCLIYDIFLGTAKSSFWIMGLLILSFILSLLIANKWNKPNAAGIILSVVANYFLMPLLYIVDGGKESGMPLWLTLAALFVWLVVDGWPCLVIYIGDIILFSSLIIYEYYHPEFVNRLSSRHDEYVDYIIGIAAVVLIFGAIFKFESRVYERKRQELEEKEKELTEINLSLEQANEAKSIFLARMSHEIRTPINAVIGMNEIIMRESTERDIIGYASNIETASHTLLSLINDILDFSKIESGLMKIVPDEYDTYDLIRECYTLLDMRARDKGLTLKLEYNEKLPSVLKGDEVRIRQIITNLLSNAVKYTDNGSITFDVDFVKKADDRIDLIIRVTDTGRGISEEGMKTIFDSFSRADERQNRNIEGTGLGLSITKQLIDLMEGSIDVKSEYGRGSEFTAVIPQTAVSSEPMGDFWAKYNVGEGTGGNYHESFKAPDARILVVDDVSVNLKIFTLLLKNTEVMIDTADSGARGLELYKENHYDMIFLDHMMPQMDGIETFEEIRKTDRYKSERTPVVVLTANAIEGADKEYLAIGFTDYLTKPVQSDELERVIVKLLPDEMVFVADR